MFIVKKFYCSETAENVQAHYRKTMVKMKNFNLIAFIIDLLAQLLSIESEKMAFHLFLNIA